MSTPERAQDPGPTGYGGVNQEKPRKDGEPTPEHTDDADRRRSESAALAEKRAES